MRPRLLSSIAACLLMLPATARADEPASRPMNVLFIVADDLRPELGCYGSVSLSPNIDRLASRGIRFERAYCQQALCNPSRSSFLTGKRPDSLRLWTNGIHFREHNPEVVTLPQWFKQHGYVTRDVGKIFHNWHTEVKGDARSWSAPEFLYYANHNADTPQIDEPLPPNLVNSRLCERRNVPDEAYYDGRVAAEAVRVLHEVKDHPFFLAVGFWKPHAPFNAPAKYWDRYEKEKVTLPTLDPARPAGAPELAFHDGRELRGAPPRTRDFSAAEVAEIRHGYFANAAYMDTQLGKVLSALEELGLADNTLIVFTGDHGYHLGEHGLWAKTSCFELDARVPLIIARPGQRNAGAVSASLSELVDLFPTLVALCGLPAPEGLEGISLVPALDDPGRVFKTAAYTQHPRPAYYDRSETGVPEAMGYSVRTPHVRYTEWRDWKTGKVLGRELYEHDRDPAETRNAIDDPADAEALRDALQTLHAAFPPGHVPSLP